MSGTASRRSGSSRGADRRPAARHPRAPRPQRGGGGGRRPGGAAVHGRHVRVAGVRVSHFGDFGQTALRDEQAEAIGTVDMLLIPVGAGPTIGPEQAGEISRRLGARWIVPMHYRTPRIGFLDPVDPFLERMPNVHRVDTPSFDTASLPEESPLVVVPKTP